MQWPDNRYRDPLPIDDRLAEILSLLKEQAVIICEAETGAGKTTRIAQAALLHDTKLKIWMTQPRRHACRWIGKRIASELGITPGKLVGWRLHGDNPVFSKTTRLELMIDQSLINRIRDRPTLPAGLIIIDEAHERSIAIDLLLALIKEKLPHSPETKVIVTSATIDTKKFSSFFNDAPILSISGRCFPVSVNVVELFRGEHHTEGAIRTAKQVLNQFLQQQLFISDEGKEASLPISKGTILVLLPGKEDIALALNSLRAEINIQHATEQIEVLSCHGESLPSEQDQAQAPIRENTLRFVCCTELLRTSVTLPETIGVIDSLQVKRLITNAFGVAVLEKVPVSKAEAEQAKGRAGRTAPGFYMPISFGSEYHTLAPWPEPAILRESLTHLILQIAAVDYSARNFDLIDRPDIEKIETTIARLKILGALTPEERITENGKALLNFPLTPELAMILLTASRLNILTEAITVVATLSVETFFQSIRKTSAIIADKALLNLILGNSEKKKSLPSWARQQGSNFEVQCGHPDFPHKSGAKWISDTLRRQWAGESQSDFTAIVRAHYAIQLEIEAISARTADKLSFNAREQHLKNWCFARGINYKKYQLARDMIAQIKESLRLSPIDLGKIKGRLSREFDENALNKAVLSGKLDHVAQHREYSSTTFFSKLGEFELEYASACSADTPIVLVDNLRKVHIRNGASHQLIASYAAPIETAWLTELAPQLCSIVEVDDLSYDLAQDAVMQTQRHYFNRDIQLGEERIIPPHEKASPVLAQWLAQRCLPNAQFVGIANSPLQAIITKNIAIQTVAHQLNFRAGKSVFKVYGTDELTNLWEPLLIGVTGFSQLASTTMLYLPELDQQLMDKVHTDCPDTIQYRNHTFPVHYTQNFPPKISINESLIMNDWIRFLAHPPQLPSGRRIDVNVIRNPRRNMTICWKGEEGHADLSSADISSISFAAESALNACLSMAERRKKLPWFLPEQPCQDTTRLNSLLDRLLHQRLEPVQLKFIQWSMAMQVIGQVEKHGKTSLLRGLAAHPFMKKRDYVSFLDNMSNTLSSLFGLFAQRQITQANAGNGFSLDVGDFINEAISNISISTRITPTDSAGSATVKANHFK